ncbi:indole-3-glycerol phosphate synthase TrpC [Eupransor demetentiae]|uniref:Indole-3-glycerol phosphate synthase n=1 Tax=Eupransor demetentiae TaxID=3109584 RepID=A0ABM9N3Z3_9LACO|nr:Indole-3-glycerol phosphate synthase (TrpC) [Lactobacillaceae bacterium LMG 33000]
MILDDLVAATKKNMATRQATLPFEELKNKVTDLPKKNPDDLLKNLRAKGMSVIAEIKQASPSKGQIVQPENFDYKGIAKEYSTAQVDMISVLTEEDYFKGSLEILKKVVAVATRPVLRKDFTIDPYMIYEARYYGASAILLIVAILSDQQLAEYLALAKKLGLVAIVEAHDEEEVQRAIKAGAEIIGINNRNLKNFTVNIQNTLNLAEHVPNDLILIAESGLKDGQDIPLLEKAGVNAVLVGESLMRAKDKAALIKELKGAERSLK